MMPGLWWCGHQGSLNITFDSMGNDGELDRNACPNKHQVNNPFISKTKSERVQSIQGDVETISSKMQNDDRHK